MKQAAGTPLRKPYILLLGMLLAALAFVTLGPRLWIQNLAAAVAANDEQALQTLLAGIKPEQLAKKLLDAELRLQMAADSKTDARDAIRDYGQAHKMLSGMAAGFARPDGFAALLRGDVHKSPRGDIHADARWLAAAEIAWQSPIAVSVDLVHPHTGWLTRLHLRRSGLFAWQAYAVELPVREILDHFAAKIGLKKNNNI